MADPHDERSDDTATERTDPRRVRLRPDGLAVSVVEELPKLAARGRERLGVRVSSARAVGQFAVKAGTDEFRRRSGGLFHADCSGGPPLPAGRHHPGGCGPAAPGSPPRGTAGPANTRAGNGHVPEVSTLSIPGFDTLSASQVVQRLDGLNRIELVSVRAYEASTRGRRTILNRVDQLLDERS